MKIYTKGGDKGRTSLANGKRVSKADRKLETYGTSDELNSFVGLLRSKLMDEYQSQQEWIQNKLFNLGAFLAGAAGEDWILDLDVEQLEQWIDTYQSDQEPLRAFVLPGGNEVVSLCHVCRTVTRRLERLMVTLKVDKTYAPDQLDVALQFVNRLSDFWFVLAMNLSKKMGISLFLWKK